MAKTPRPTAAQARILTVFAVWGPSIWPKERGNHGKKIQWRVMNTCVKNGWLAADAHARKTLTEAGREIVRNAWKHNYHMVWEDVVTGMGAYGYPTYTPVFIHPVQL